MAADPMKTRSGKPRLGPLNVAQLTELLNSARKKTKAKILRRIEVLKSRPGYKEKVVAE